MDGGRLLSFVLEKNHLSICFPLFLSLMFDRFLEASSVFGVNQISLKLASAFLLLRLLRINDEESWSK